MSLFKKKADPISDRSRTLNAEIAALEAQIKKLNSKVEHARSGPRLRSTAWPHGHSPQNGQAPEPNVHGADPIFESVDRRPVSAVAEAGATPDGPNELGTRRYGLVAIWRRWQNHFRGPTSSNAKLISYLAAGSIKGLRPLRYEKRVARNRFIALFVALVLLLLGLLYSFLRNH